MCSLLSAVFNRLSQERDESTKELVSLKPRVKGNEWIPGKQGLLGVKGEVALCAQGVENKTEEVLSRRVF